MDLDLQGLAPMIRTASLSKPCGVTQQPLEL